METVTTVITPTKLAHVVFQTNQKDTVRDWYCTVIGARVVHEDDVFCFLTYDDEHHRIALLQDSSLEPAPANAIGIHHTAFTYGSLEALFATYERLKAADILPWMPINHGMTTSLYYRDPDGRAVELQVDNFESAEEGLEFMQSATFKNNPVGVSIDPDDMVTRLRAGDTVDPVSEYAAG